MEPSLHVVVFKVLLKRELSVTSQSVLVPFYGSR